MKEDNVRKGILREKMNSYTKNLVSTFRLMSRRQSNPPRGCFIFCLLTISLFSLAATTTATAATYYLDAGVVGGNDDGTSWANAWNTLAKAQAAMLLAEANGSGNIILVRNGSYGAYSESGYNEATVTQRTDWLTYQADAGHAPTLTNISIDNQGGMYDVYLRFDGFVIQSPTSLTALVDARCTKYFQLLNCNVKGLGGDSESYTYFGLRAWNNSDEITIDNCTFSGVDSGRWDGFTTVIDITEADNITISDCNIMQFISYGIYSACHDVNIHNNTIHFASMDMGIGISGGNGPMNISNNKVYDALIYTPALSETPTETTWNVAGNTMTNNDATWGVDAPFTWVGNVEIYVVSGTNVSTGDNDIRVSAVSANEITFDGSIASGGQPSNVVYSLRSKDHPDLIQFLMSPPTVHNVTIRNNQFYESNGQIGNISPYSTAEDSNWLIENNLFWNDWGEAESTALWIDDINGLNFRNNIVIAGLYMPDNHNVTMTGNIISYLIGTSGLINNDYNIICRGGITEPGTLGENSTLLHSGESAEDWNDPAFTGIFTDYANGDFRHASADSLGVDHGDPANYPATDILGVSRSIPPDAGCYEYITDSNDSNEPVVAQYVLTTSSTSGGSVTTPGQGQYSYDANSVVSIQATADSNYHFVNWTGTAVTASKVANANSANTTVTVDANYTVVANFAIDEHTLTISSTAGGSVTTPGEGASQYDNGTEVSIQATAESNYDFVSWTGTAVTAGKVANASSAITTVTADANYSLIANFSVNQRTLTASSTAGGSVTTPAEGASQHNHGTELSIQATAEDNYHFVNWTGTAVTAGKVASAGSASTTVTMDADYTLVANFTIDEHALTASSTAGGSVTTPGEGAFQYDHGTDVSVLATAETNYHFVNWTGTAVDAGDVANTSSASTTVTMDLDYTLVANFAIDEHTITVSSTTGGSVTTPGEGTFQYDHDTDVSIQATPDDEYYFSNWTGTAVDAGKVANANTAGTTVTADADYTVVANFSENDELAPIVSNLSPEAGSIQNSLNTLVYLSITDAGKGVDASTVIIEINGNLVYTGDTQNYNSSYGNCRRTGTIASYRYSYQADENFDYDQTITVTVNATDLGSNIMDEYSYSFETEMQLFGKNLKINTVNSNHSSPATIKASNGDIWVAWETEVSGIRDIYVGKLSHGDNTLTDSANITNNDSVQSLPAIAIDSTDRLYLTWQDYRNSEWDIYMSTSTDGITWSAARKISDPNSDQTKPAIAIDNTDKAYITWQDNQNGNNDIYIASSSSLFVTKSTTQVTSNASSQTSPDIAITASNRVYLLWEDNRAGTSDIYGADSLNGPWTNVAVVSKSGSQTDPAIAAEASGEVMHWVWTDNTPGDNDIYYASSTGLPASTVAGSSIIDDTANADQTEPAINVNGSTGNNLKVFICWKDERNVANSNGDTDIYFVEANSGSGTNILVGDDGTNSTQSNPAIGIDGYGYPYIVFSDDRNANTDIYFAGSSFISPTILNSENLSSLLGALIGIILDNITNITDVSVTIPANACQHNVTITISEVLNPPNIDLDSYTTLYDFGPSGIEFDLPVTITIPYNPANIPGTPTAYWYNPLTGLLSQEGITDIETVQISSNLYALSFQTTHFTQFLVGAAAVGAIAGGGGGGGGGCSMSPDSNGSIIEYLLPYLILAVVMVILKLRDRRNKKANEDTGCER